jgi:hypothetical protein
MITDNQLEFIRRKLNEMEHGKVTIVIQDNGAKLDIVTESRERVLREEGCRQIELIESGAPCKVRAIRSPARMNNKQDERYLTKTAKRI